MRMYRWAIAAFASCLLGAGLCDAQPNAPARMVQDDLNWFSAAAREKANADIARIKSQFHKDLAIETLKAPTQLSEVDPKDTVAVNKFFDNWAVTRFKNERVDGVLVLLVDQPKIARVLVGPETEHRLFPATSRDELRTRLVEHLKKGDRDGALSSATAYVLDVMGQHHRTAANPPVVPAQHEFPAQGVPVQRQPNLMNLIWIGLGVLLVVWVVSALVRALSGGGGGYGMGGGYGGGGGGFMSSMLGGLFGAAAGMWMYDRFFGHGGSSGWGGTTAGFGGSDASREPSDIGGGDPSVSGGDYGGGGNDVADAGGGGDNWNDAGDFGGGGGGDFGGGFGGGDFGGGGGDW